MQHLDGDFSINEPKVPLVVKLGNSCCLEGNERSYSHFHGDTYGSFSNFPKRHGWKVLPDKRLELDEIHNPQVKPPLAKAELLQSWLFFGLIHLVVRAGKPLLQPEDLIGHGRIVNTQHLPAALHKWQEYEKKDPARARLRLIHADLAIELARQVVLANLAEKPQRQLVQSAPRGILSRSQRHEDVGPEITLSLMVLGETLSEAKEHIIKALGVQVRGWHKEDEGGWGPASFISEKMKEDNWCPRVQRILQEQLGSNATLLLAAMNHANRDDSKGHGDRCTPDRCYHVAGPDQPQQGEGADLELSYVPQHRDKDCRCKKVGPEMKDILDVLRDAGYDNEHESFPLVRIVGEEFNISAIRVVSRTRELEGVSQQLPFVTISHVWAQGLGNDYKNELHQCQLEFLRTLLAQVNINDPDPDAKAKGWSIPFWMDTLLIPVTEKKRGESTIGEGQSHKVPILNNDFRLLKQRSIRQIYHVFDQATHSIVVDSGLWSTHFVEPTQVAMKVLTSAWMRRLWTLQEAFLSRKLKVTFKDANGGVELRDLDDEIISPLHGQDGDEGRELLTLALQGMAKKRLLPNLMVEERDTRFKNGDEYESRGSMLISSAWRSVRWRTTNRLSDETLALAPLLNLDYRKTEITKGGGVDSVERKPPDGTLEAMMEDFWKIVHKTYEGSIPPGMIFLPGPKLSRPGFGWAPRTWMACQDETHPYPLSLPHAPTQLDTEGLLVQYPGFLLHCHSAKEILAPIIDGGHRTCNFPVDRDLLEWYQITAIDKSRSEMTKYTQKLIEEHPTRPSQFAIIISRPRPRERPSEIGILVLIYDTPRRWKHEDPKRKKLYCCWIIHRVLVCRIKAPEQFSPPRYYSVTDEVPDQPIGEVVDDDQGWYVDDYLSNPELKYQPPQVSADDAPAPALQRSTSIIRQIWASVPQMARTLTS